MLNDSQMLDRDRAIAWYRRNRARTRTLFDLVAESAYYTRPIDLRHPIVFYEGHLPAFSFNTLVKKALGGPGIDARLEAIFARGIDPHENTTAAGSVDAGPDRAGWPSRDEVHAFADEADARVLDALCHADLERPGDPLLDRADAVFTILEHEAMHHETLLYMWQRLSHADKHRPDDGTPRIGDGAPTQEWLEVPGGKVTLGVDRGDIPFGWDNEFPRCEATTAAFFVERFNVTNAQFLEFVAAGGYTDPRWWRAEDWTWVQREGMSHPLFWERSEHAWRWRGMFESVPLPPAWPVYVSYAEAAAYARWRGGRLMSEAEYQRAAYGSPSGERPYPWGNVPPSSEHGIFDFSSWDPQPAGTHPAGRSAWGVDDLVGNGWEWTSTPFAPFPGFRPAPSYPEYSADFFDGEHLVMKGASPATAAELIRPTFRNWFRPRYPYVYATFRCVAETRRA
jgi:iron(II)-dependent oxidoreductase